MRRLGPAPSMMRRRGRVRRSGGQAVGERGRESAALRARRGGVGVAVRAGVDASSSPGGRLTVIRAAKRAVQDSGGPCAVQAESN